MPTWICPFCEAKMNVKPNLVGQTRPCANCKQESEIVDAAAALLPPELFDDDAAPLHQGTPAVGVQAPIMTGSDPVGDSLVSTESLTSVSLAYGLLILTAVCSGLCILIALVGGSQNPAPAFQLGFTGLVSVVIAWPIYTIANETFRSRRLLEIVLKRLK